jgi:cytochrome c biogenesis protein CcmG/thiol:disulfide interchange protein DsbE
MGARRLAKAPTGKEQRQARAKWTTWAVVGGLAVVLGAMIVVVTMQSRGKAAPGASGVARTGRPAPDFTLTLFNGQKVALSSLKGKPVLVNFWHSA